MRQLVILNCTCVNDIRRQVKKGQLFILPKRDLLPSALVNAVQCFALRALSLVLVLVLEQSPSVMLLMHLLIFTWKHIILLLWNVHVWQHVTNNKIACV